VRTSAAVSVPQSQPVQPAPLRRSRSGAVVAGVCAGLGPRLGVDPIMLRVGFLIASVAGGIGIGLYIVCWLLIPAGEGARTERRVRGKLGRRESWQVAGGIVLLMLALLLLFRAWGIWIGDAIVWPLVLASGGGALIWRQSQGAAVVEPPAREQAKPGGGAGRPRRLRLRLARPSLGIVALGAALVVGAALVFLWLNGALELDRDVTLAVLVVVVALTLILAPWWLRLGRGLTEERAERIRTQERAEMAAHLHDSVLQTLALMQKRAGDPREVAALARRQERELRAWLNGASRRSGSHPPASLAAALEEAVAEIEDAHGVPVDVVAVGDRPLDERAEALVAAAREAVLNAVKFAPEGAISVYAEVRGDRAEVFVRDRGPGFDLAAVPADRRGLRESVVGRMERHGGRAEIHTLPGEGTEVELVIGRE
jgi:phage shock protein PspC (stress-responsive transcriptional regulator)